MGIIEAIAGFFKALPQILSMIQGLMGWINKVSGGDAVGFLNKANDAFTKLHAAQSEQETADAAKALQDLIRGMR